MKKVQVREVFDNAILKDLPDANIRLTLGHNEAILKIVAGGLGMSCISKLATEPLREKGQLVVLIRRSGLSHVHCSCWCIVRSTKAQDSKPL